MVVCYICSLFVQFADAALSTCNMCLWMINGCSRCYPCLQVSATGWRSCSVSGSVEQAELERWAAPRQPPASPTRRHPETPAAIVADTSTVLTITPFSGLILPPVSRFGHLDMRIRLNSPCSGSLCCGWPGSAAGWSQHCPAGGRALPLERAISIPSPWFQSGTSCSDRPHTINPLATSIKEQTVFVFSRRQTGFVQQRPPPTLMNKCYTPPIRRVKIGLVVFA